MKYYVRPVMSWMRQYLFERGISPHKIQQQRGKGCLSSFLENRLDYKGPALHTISRGSIQRLGFPLRPSFGGRILFHMCLPLKGTAAPVYSGAAYICGCLSGAAGRLFSFRCSFAVFATHPRRVGVLLLIHRPPLARLS